MVLFGERRYGCSDGTSYFILDCLSEIVVLFLRVRQP